MTRLRRSLAMILLAAPAMAPSMAHADLIDRYETAVETYTTNFIAFYVSRVPELDGNLPPAEWEDIDRDIGVCVLETYEAAKGPEATEALVIFLESMASKDIASIADIEAAMEPLIYDRAAVAASESCGQYARSEDLIAKTRMVEILSNPDAVARLYAQ